MKNRIESLISFLREKNRDSHFRENRAALTVMAPFLALCLFQTLSISPTAEINAMDSLSLSASFDTSSAEPPALNTRNPSFEAHVPEDSKQRVNKGFGVSEILGPSTHSSCSYRSSILEFFTNAAK